MSLKFKITLEYENDHLTVDYNDGSATEGYDLSKNPAGLPDKVRQLIQDEIDEYNRIDKFMATATDSFYNCAGCGTAINTGDKYIICSDCGGVFCETCAHNGTFENHECEDED